MPTAIGRGENLDRAERRESRLLLSHFRAATALPVGGDGHRSAPCVTVARREINRIEPRSKAERRTCVTGIEFGYGNLIGFLNQRLEAT